MMPQLPTGFIPDVPQGFVPDPPAPPAPPKVGSGWDAWRDPTPISDNPAENTGPSWFNRQMQALAESGMTSPENLALTALGQPLSGVIPHANQLYRVGQGIVGLGMGALGLNQAKQAKDWNERLGGLLTFGLGMIPAYGSMIPNRANLPVPRPQPEVPLAQRVGGDVLNTQPRVASTAVEATGPQAGTPPFSTTQFGLHPQQEPANPILALAPNRLKAPSTNATVFDALLPDKFKRNVEGEAPTSAIGEGLTPPTTVPEGFVPDAPQQAQAPANAARNPEQGQGTIQKGPDGKWRFIKEDQGTFDPTFGRDDSYDSFFRNRIAALIAPDGTQHIAEGRQIHGDLAQKLFPEATNQIDALDQAFNTGYIRYLDNGSQLALEFQAGQPAAMNNALKMIKDNFRRGQTIFMDIDGLGSLQTDNLREANQFIRQAGDQKQPQSKWNQFFGNEEGAFNPRQLRDFVTGRFRKASEQEVQKQQEFEQQANENQGPIGKLINAMNAARPLREQQDQIYSQERAKRFAQFGSTPVQGEEGARLAMSKLRGPLSKVQVESLRPKLGQEDVDGLFKMIASAPHLSAGEKATAYDGLWKLLGEHGSHVPQPSELAQLERVYGKGFAPAVQEMYGALGGLPVELTHEVVNLPRSLMASFDLSAPLRQGLAMGAAHPVMFAKALPTMFKSAWSQEMYNQAQQAIRERPLYDLGERAGLQLTDMRSIGNREERYISQLPEKLPTLLGGGIFRGSNRAYVGFLNKLRADSFDYLIKQAVKEGELAPFRDVKGNMITDSPWVENEIAGYVNNATGRGSLGPLEAHAKLLNATFFSPRLMASRFKFLDPRTYVSPRIGGTTNSPMVRRQYLRSALGVAGAATLLTELGKLGGAQVSHDPTNPDFMKLKFGNTRIDMMGGFQQPIVALARMLEGEKTSSITGKTAQLNTGKYGAGTRYDVARDFFESKLNPVWSLGIAMLKGREQSGAPMNYSSLNPMENSIMQRFVPMFIQDLYDLAQEDSSLGIKIGTGAAGLFGGGVQTYQARTKYPTVQPGTLQPSNLMQLVPRAFSDTMR